MSQEEEGQIRDMSKTIMSGTSSMPRSVNPVANTSSQTSDENMDISLRRIIDESVGTQVADMKRMIADLTATVGKLSTLVYQTQVEQKRLVENNLPSTSKAANGMGSNRSSRDSSTNSSDHVRYEKRPGVDKWGLEFDGDQNKLAVEDFVFRVERLQRQYGAPWREVLDNFHLLVKGNAEKWYWLYIQTNYVTEWNTLKQALLKQYQSARSSFELMRDMVERRQLPGESIDAFFFAMMQLRSRLTISMPEEEMIKMIKKNLREGIGKIVYPMSVSSVEELKMCCMDAEKTFLRRDQKPQPTPISRLNRQVNELCQDLKENYYEDQLKNEEVAEVRLNGSNGELVRALVCWNCRQKGHMFMDCTAEERTIFCYRCGKPDTFSPNCSNCRSKNFQKNEGRAGDLCCTGKPQSNH